MVGYIDIQGNYHEGDIQPGDIEVPRRPSPYHVWANGEWVSDSNILIKEQILRLEAQQTPRRMREAALGIDNGWLADIDAQISALRSQLT